MAKNNGNLKANGKDIAALLADGRKIDAAMKRAAKAAVWKHQLAGNPIAAWRGGKVVWIKSPTRKLKV